MVSQSWRLQLYSRHVALLCPTDRCWPCSRDQWPQSAWHSEKWGAIWSRPGGSLSGLQWGEGGHPPTRGTAWSFSYLPLTHSQTLVCCRGFSFLVTWDRQKRWWELSITEMALRKLQSFLESKLELTVTLVDWLRHRSVVQQLAHSHSHCNHAVSSDS